MREIASRHKPEESPLAYELDVRLEWASDLHVSIRLPLPGLPAKTKTAHTKAQKQAPTAAAPAVGAEGARWGLPLLTVAGAYVSGWVLLTFTDPDWRTYVYEHIDMYVHIYTS